MEFRIKTEYDQQALKVLANTLRKTLRRKRSKRSHIFGWLVIVLGLTVTVLDLLIGEQSFDVGTAATIGAVLLVFLTMLNEDALNGWIAGRNQMPNMKHTETVFGPEEYTSVTQPARTTWRYDQILAAYERPGYFVFFLSPKHGQVYDKSGFEMGTPEEFRDFIAEKTGKPVEWIK